MIISITNSDNINNNCNYNKKSCKIFAAKIKEKQ